MSRLSSLLVQEGLLSIKKTEEALQRQVIFGGSLDTILFEMGVLDEELLLACLSRSSGLPAAQRDLALAADPAAAQALPREVAERFGAAPWQVAAGKLRVVVNEALDPAALEELARATGFPVEPFIATEIRVFQLLDRQYGQPVPPRFLALLAKMSPAVPEEMPAASTEKMDVAAITAVLQAATGAAPAAVTAAVTAADAPDRAPDRQEDAREPREPPGAGEVSGRWIEPGAAGPPAAPVALRAEVPTPALTLRYPEHVPPMRAGNARWGEARPALLVEGGRESPPLMDDAPPEDSEAAVVLARDRLSVAQDREAIFDALAAAGAAFLEYVAVLTVHGTSLVGRVIFTRGQPDHVSAASVAVEATAPSVLSDATQAGGPYIGVIGSDAPGRALLEAIGRPPSSIALLLPVTLKGRVVCLLYGDRAPRPVSVGRVAPLLPLAQDVSEAFLRLIVQSKGAGRAETTTPPRVARPPAAPSPEAAGAPRANGAPREPTGQSVPPPSAAPDSPMALQPTLPVARADTAEAPSPASPSFEALVERVEHGAPTEAHAAGEALLQNGPAGLAALMRRFPGLLVVEPRAARGRLPASQHGPVLGLVPRFGFAAVQALVSQLTHSDAIVRFYATALFGEIHAPEAVRHVHFRLYDADPLVRSAAIDSLRSYEGTVALRTVLEALRADLVDPDPLRRRIAAEALGELRDPEAIPRLIEVACSSDTAAEVARRSLVALTRTDFGTSRWRWRTWWDKNRKRDRIEWLLDALAAKEPEHRLAASEELSRLAGDTFGYHFDLPKREREEARRRFLDWWETSGRRAGGHEPEGRSQ